MIERRKAIRELSVALRPLAKTGTRHTGRRQAIREQEVRAGDVIGREGMTGFATGCHLHYTLVRMDGPWQVVVPELDLRELFLGAHHPRACAEWCSRQLAHRDAMVECDQLLAERMAVRRDEPDLVDLGLEDVGPVAEEINVAPSYQA